MTIRLTLLPGDRNGIGPELLAKFLAEPAGYEGIDLEVLGDPDVVQQGADAAGVSLGNARYRQTDFRPVDGIATTRAQETADAGRECLDLLVHASTRVLAGDSDGVVFAPLNKQAMHLGGLTHEDEMQFLADELKWDGLCGELNVMDTIDSLWTTRVTSHIPLKDVAQYITHDGVLGAIRFADDTLKSAGFDKPRVGVAALNPHAGDGGNFGMEEIEVIGPATETAAAEGIDVTGPLPSDTIFVRATKGQFDVVVTMYHDQGQIAMKLMGFGRGVTVLGGLPVPIATCAHGTAYDIAGQGVATPDSFKNAFAICKAISASRLAAAETGERNAS